MTVPAKQFQLHIRDYCPRAYVPHGTVVCTDCQEIKERSDFYPSLSYGFICIPCVRIRANAHYAKPATQTRRKYQLAEKMYGLTRVQYEALEAAQGGLCAICGLPPSGRDSKTDGLQVDHDHISGKARELLCTRCNHMIGNCRDSVALLLKAIDYLLKHGHVGVVS